MRHRTVKKQLWSTWHQGCIISPDGKIGAKILRQILLPRKHWLRNNSQKNNHHTRIYSLFIVSNQRVTCPLQSGRLFMRRQIQTWLSSSRFGKGSLRFPWRVSFCDYKNYCATLQSVEADNQRNHPMRALAEEILPKVGTTFALRHSKSQSDGNGNWPVEHPPLPSGLFFFSDCDRRRVLISLPISLWLYVRSQPRWSNSKTKATMGAHRVMLTILLAVWVWS
jgi:hypothetical protein